MSAGCRVVQPNGHRSTQSPLKQLVTTTVACLFILCLLVLLGTLNEYELLKKMNQATAQRYVDMTRVAEKVKFSMKELNDKSELFESASEYLSVSILLLSQRLLYFAYNTEFLLHFTYARALLN
ncbi:unnamed protein product [Soboliphyme baturini]|uniref:Cache_2 domain-containing protein n=1 Tax=Soboliphyme baturini TaxID=241478 RepID=A0A183J3D9_9BILA|nr:unnamed protein product [Soboliphyme baturini]